MVVHAAKGTVSDEVMIGQQDWGDVVKRLREKNRNLEQELAHLVNTRESFYAKKVSEAFERCEHMIKEKEEAHKDWQERHQRNLDETRAGAVIMFSLFVSKKRRLLGEIKGNQENSEQQLAAAREKIAQLEADHASTTQKLQQRLENTIADYEVKLARQRADADERISSLEQQLSAARDETHSLQEAATGAKAEIQDLHLQLQRRLADMERLEGLVAAPRTMIKEIQNRAKLQKEALEKEIGDYVRFIVATHRAASPETAAMPTVGPSACHITAVRPSTPQSPSPKVPRPMQVPTSARAALPTSLPPLGDEGQGAGGSRPTSKYRPETLRY